jgi:hypothetical protein
MASINVPSDAFLAGFVKCCEDHNVNPVELAKLASLGGPGMLTGLGELGAGAGGLGNKGLLLALLAALGVGGTAGGMAVQQHRKNEAQEHPILHRLGMK